ncbi:hypothetical protein ACPRNU_12650 [Chromobacterium vaccinii]|uniref:hypothetical protein n=1 Tax=Chromobacterium vaccinii TaxID=1108595 RepID=UPI003C78926F
MANCVNCSEGMEWLGFVKADVFESQLNGRPTIDIVLKCPHCGQEYNTFELVENLTPVGEF